MLSLTWSRSRLSWPLHLLLSPESDVWHHHVYNVQCHQAELHPRGPGPDTAMSCYQCPASDWSIWITWPEYWPLIGCHTPIIILWLAHTRPTFCSASNSWDNLDGMVARSTLTTLPCRFNIITRYVGAAQRTPHQTPGPGSGFPAWLLMWLATNITGDHVSPDQVTGTSAIKTLTLNTRQKGGGPKTH